jgi:phosphoglucosamine mutase
MKVVVDAAHGAAYHRAQGLPRAGAAVVSIGCSADGMNINHEVGATHPRRWWSGAGTRPTTAWRWTAMPTACNGRREGRLFNGDELLY